MENTKLKKSGVALVGVASLPAAFMAGSALADFAYKRLLFQGYDISDLTPGDGAGVTLLTWISCGALVLADAVFWIRFYRRISR